MADKVTGEIRDPHVFPYIVKGFNPSTEEVRYESRRDLEEAKQTRDRFRSENFQVFLFRIVEVNS